MRRASTARSALTTVITSVGLLFVNLVTGILVSRLLGPSGRGIVAAITSYAQTLAWLAALGFTEALTFKRARHAAVADVVTVGAVGTLVLSCLGLLVAELLLPVAFTAQPENVRHFCQLYLPVMFLMAFGSSASGLIAGDQDFRLLNILRAAQPVIYALLIITLALTGQLTAYKVLAASAASTAVTTIYSCTYVVRTMGLNSLDWALLRSTLAYGARLIGALVGALGNARLDITVMPAVLGAADIGLYSVATSVAAMMVGVSGSLSLVLLPVAAHRSEEDAVILLERSLRGVLAVGVVGSLALAATTPLLIPLLYGRPFVAALPSLYLLLPGTICLAGSTVVDSGLQAFNQPGRSSLNKTLGLIVTVVGLALLLRPLGIAGAALVSTLAYSASFVFGTILLQKGSGFRIRRAWSVEAYRLDLLDVLSRLRGALRRPGRADRQGSGPPRRG